MVSEERTTLNEARLATPVSILATFHHAGSRAFRAKPGDGRKAATVRGGKK